MADESDGRLSRRQEIGIVLVMTAIIGGLVGLAALPEGPRTGPVMCGLSVMDPSEICVEFQTTSRRTG